MGYLPAPKKCYLTDIENPDHIDSQRPDFQREYSIRIDGKPYVFRFPESFNLQTLRERKFITGIDVTGKGGENLADIKLTFEGLNYVIDIQESGKTSNRCFIAMSFSNIEPIRGIREAIRSIVEHEEIGFNAVLVDETHYESDKTINEAIIAEIKKSRFCIADFTEQKDGVYFEAGFALGRGLPVIYTCRKDYFEKSHFDTNRFPHIIYEDVDELKRELKNKIEAWIL